MKHRRKHVVLIVMVWLIAAGRVMAQQYPSVGTLIMNDASQLSKISNGCVLRFDTTARQLLCVSLDQIAGRRKVVTLVNGVRTVVTDATVTAVTRVRCGCEGGSGSGADASCNVGGAWLAKVRTLSTQAGSFTVAHGYALGGEQITCTIDGG